MQRRRFLGALAALFGASNLRIPAAAAGNADLIVTGATIHAVDSRFSGATAFAVRNGHFTFVGSRAGAMALRGDSTRVLDLSGSTVVPGLVDAHLHLIGTGFTLHEVD